MSEVRERIEVYGRVQGVGFRYTTMLNAQEQALTGWVKNNDDFSVSIEVQGPEVAVIKFRSNLKKPHRFIRVDQLNYRRIALQEETTFRIR